MFNASSVKQLSSDIKVGIDQVSYRIETYDSMIQNGQTLSPEDFDRYESWKSMVARLEYDALFLCIVADDIPTVSRTTRIINALLPKKK